MIEIKPSLEIKYSCPSCKGMLRANDFHITGMRNFYDCFCEKCHREFFADIPVGHALFYPTLIEKKSNVVYAPYKAVWFSNLFVKEVTQEKIDSPVRVIGQCRQKSVIVLNCLDYLYGHSLVKLFNLSALLPKISKETGILVIIPENLLHLLPKGVDETWVIKGILKSFILWNLTIDKKFHDFVGGKKEVSLAEAYPAPPYSKNFNLLDFAHIKKNLKDKYNHPTFLFSYRHDRVWGRSVHDQKARIIELSKILKSAFPNFDFAVGNGFKDEISFPEPIVDCRFLQSDSKTENNLLEMLSKTDVVIGVHGSHMIMPSGLCGAVVNLLSTKKYGNYTQDYLIKSNNFDVYENLYRFMTIRGNDDLSNISPIIVANTIIDYLQNIKWRLEEIELGKTVGDFDSWEVIKQWQKANENE